MSKPNPKDYGFENANAFDGESGWMIEGGEEAYFSALDRWNEKNKLDGVKYEIGGNIISRDENLIKEFELKEVSIVPSRPSGVLNANFITDEEKRAFGLHMKYGIMENKTKYIKPKVEGWRLVLLEGRIETTLPNMNDKPYALLQSEKNKLEREKTYPKGKLIIKPKI